MLIEMDEWGQLVAMRVLTVYVRRCFNKPAEDSTENKRAEQFYDDTSGNTSSLDPDLELLYKCALQLVYSRSSAVCLSTGLTDDLGRHRSYSAVPRPCTTFISSPPNAKFDSASTDTIHCITLSGPLKHRCHRIAKPGIV